MVMQRFDAAAAREAWDAGAEAWRRFVRDGGDYYRHEVHGPALLAACAVRSGERALDLGCGEGYFARLLARNGARVTAIDHSARMIEFARETEGREPTGIEFILGDACSRESHGAEGSFDLVTSCMAIQDMSDPAACLVASARSLRTGGRMVFSVPHPCTDTVVREWERDHEGGKVVLRIDRYFETGADTTNWNFARLAYAWSTPCWRHTLEQWTEMTAAAGFLIRRVREPRPTDAQVREKPQLDDCARVPYFVIFELVKS